MAEILGILGNAGYDRLIEEVVHQRSLLAWLLVVGYTEVRCASLFPIFDWKTRL